MHSSLTRQAVRTALSLILAIPITVVLWRAVSQPSIDIRARSWAASLSDSARVANLLRNDLPAAYVKALRANLSPAGRVDLFKRKIVLYRERHPALSADHQAYLDQAVALLESGRLYDPRGRAILPPDERLAMTVAANRLFPDPAERAALFGIEASDSASRAHEPILNRLAAWVLAIAPGAVLRAEEATCECSTANDWCGGGEHCCSDSGCFPSVWNVEDYWMPGCGWFLQYQCNGDCIPEQM